MSDLKKQLEAEIKLWQAKIDKLKVQIELGTMEAREKLQPQLDKLELEYDKAMKELEKFDDAAEHAWENIKTGVDNSVKEMKEAFDKAAEHFK